MRLRLCLNKDRLAAISAELTSYGIEIDQESDLILTEESYNEGSIICRDGAEKIIVPIEDICFIEALGHDVFVNTQTNTYKTNVRLYRMELLLPPNQFIRISNAVIIGRNSVLRIKPALGCRFFLTLKNGASVDVTRTYYYRFKDFFGI